MSSSTLADALASLTSLTTATALATILSGLAVLWMSREAKQRFWFSFSNLPGPRADSFMRGSFPSLLAKETGQTTREWFDKYGPTIQWRSLLYTPNILTCDLGLASYVLSHDDEFGRSKSHEADFRRLLGDRSLMTVDRSDHKRLRKIMAPAFGVGPMSDQWPIFLHQARRLVDKVGPEGRQIGASSFMGMFTTDVMGMASSGTNLGAMDGAPNELYTAWMGILQTTRLRGVLWQIKTKLAIPGTWLHSERVLGKSKDTFQRIGDDIVQTRKRELLGEGHEVTRSDFGSKNVISTLLKANMAQDVKDSSRMSDEELVSLLSTLILASTVTTTSTLIWCLSLLATRPETQARLRAEVMDMEDEPTMNDISKLPFLEAFVRELLRLNSAAPTITRHTHKTVTVPLSTPIVGKNGSLIHAVTIDKGTDINIAVPSVNTSKEIYGPDAEEFRPERFMDGAVKATGLPSIWGQSLTFSAGTRPCLGFRFAIMQVKATVFALLRSFEVSQPEGQEVVRMGMIASSKTIVKGTNKSDIPIIFKPLSS
ncbi:cytochrome P450 [Kockovaella imperatae]|uniref:Cytochrome P450 n=1 Tax=Kockovaella imperatae TaxID=4999 RepID=A0A1Y1UFM9_9TREE|nr:cytochrome P450 [Kockovaella imperatae]ORX36853.1 cytochrome P450 [Kockovaella imperatae]